jgi:hypothetical protein
MIEATSYNKISMSFGAVSLLLSGTPHITRQWSAVAPPLATNDHRLSNAGRSAESEHSYS